MLGNSDAHGKNISFYVRQAGLEVAELYDLVSMVQYDPTSLEHDLAMAFGDEFSLNGLGVHALADFCVRCGIPRVFFARELAAVCTLAGEQAKEQALDGVYQGGERDFVRGIAALVEARAKALLTLATEIPKFRSNAF